MKYNAFEKWVFENTEAQTFDVENKKQKKLDL